MHGMIADSLGFSRRIDPTEAAETATAALEQGLGESAARVQQLARPGRAAAITDTR
jgi:hypothetical protein